MLTALSQLRTAFDQSNANQRVAHALAANARDVSAALAEGLRIVREEQKRDADESSARAKSAEASVLNSLAKFGEVLEEVFAKVWSPAPPCIDFPSYPHIRIRSSSRPGRPPPFPIPPLPPLDKGVLYVAQSMNRGTDDEKGPAKQLTSRFGFTFDAHAVSEGALDAYSTGQLRERYTFYTFRRPGSLFPVMK